jgi:hypothetical protein
MKRANVLWVQGVAAFAALVCVGMATLLGRAPAAHAAAPARAQSAPFGALMAQEILTDAYESNNNIGEAKSLSMLACTSPIVVSNLTINPISDVDYFRLSPTPNITFEVRVAGQTPIAGRPNDLQVVVDLLDQNQQAITTDATSPGGSLTFSYRPGNGNAIYVRISAPNVAEGSYKPYSISACNTSTTAQATATPASASPDVYEPNDNPHAVLNPQSGIIRSFLNVGSTFANTQLPNFYGPGIPLGYIQASGDVDWFFFYGRGGGRYRVTTSVQAGVDTEMFLFSESPTLLNPNFNNSDGTGQLSYNDDYQAGDRGSRIEFVGIYDGRYWLKVWNKDPGPRSGAPGYNPSYNVAVQEVTSISMTATPGPTPYPQGADRFEYNGDWDSSTLIAPNAKYDNLNFVPFMPPTRDTIDNDFFRMPVKQGVYYTCETLDLSPGTDTNLIVYNQNAPQNLEASLIAGNDNVSMLEASRGNFASRVAWLSGYTGIAYLLVGDVTPPRANEAQARSYSLQCTIGLPPTLTPTIDPNPTETPRPPAAPFVPPTAEPPDPTMTPYPTPKAAQNLVVRPADPDAPVIPTPTTAPQLTSMTVFVFTDRNRNAVADPGEGIENVAVRIIDDKGTPLRWLLTNADGRARFLDVPIAAPVRVAVPYVGYNAVVDDPSRPINVAVQSALEIPATLP